MQEESNWLAPVHHQLCAAAEDSTVGSHKVTQSACPANRLQNQGEDACHAKLQYAKSVLPQPTHLETSSSSPDSGKAIQHSFCQESILRSKTLLS